MFERMYNITFVSESSFSSLANEVALADFTSLGEPTPLSTKSPLLSCLWKGENVPVDRDSTMPGERGTLEGSGTVISNSCIISKDNDKQEFSNNQWKLLCLL